MSKKVLILMASPRTSGSTNALCAQFANGAREAGHQVTQIDFSHHKLNPCLGCNFCANHRGKCCQPDDMNTVLEIFAQSDVIVLASPLYYYSISAQLKIFIDRLYAPGIINHFQYQSKESVLIMTAGEDSQDIFTQPLQYYHLLLQKIFPWKHRGEILVGGFSNHPSIEGHSSLNEAYELGKSL